MKREKKMARGRSQEDLLQAKGKSARTLVWCTVQAQTAVKVLDWKEMMGPCTVLTYYYPGGLEGQS